MADGNLFGIDFGTILSVLVIAAVAIAIERLFTTYLSRFAKRAKMERNAAAKPAVPAQEYAKIAQEEMRTKGEKDEKEGKTRSPSNTTG
jgi:hypothetical protein